MKYSNPNDFWRERRDLYHDDPIEKGLRRAMKCLAVAIVVMLAAAASRSLVGCKSPRPMQSDSARDSVRITDSVRISDSVRVTIHHVIRDSVRIKDSTVVVLDSAGNVKHLKEYHSEKQHTTVEDTTSYYKSLFNDAVLELIREREASKETVIEKPLTAWEAFKVDYGGYAILIVAGALVFFIGRLVLSYYFGK